MGLLLDGCGGLCRTPRSGRPTGRPYVVLARCGGFGETGTFQAGDVSRDAVYCRFPRRQVPWRLSAKTVPRPVPPRSLSSLHRTSSRPFDTLSAPTPKCGRVPASQCLYIETYGRLACVKRCVQDGERTRQFCGVNVPRRPYERLRVGTKVRSSFTKVRRTCREGTEKGPGARFEPRTLPVLRFTGCTLACSRIAQDSARCPPTAPSATYRTRWLSSRWSKANNRHNSPSVYMTN